MVAYEGLMKRIKKIIKRGVDPKKIKKFFGDKKLFPFYYFAGSLLLFFSAYNLSFAKKTFPGSYVAGIYVGNKAPDEIIEALKRVQTVEKVIIKNEDSLYEIDTKSLDVKLDPEKTAKRVFDYFRTGNPFIDIKRRLVTPITFKNFGFSLNLDKNKLNETLLIISDEIITEPIYPKVSLIEGEIVVNKGVRGERINVAKLVSQIESNLSFLKTDPVFLEKEIIDPTLSEGEVKVLQSRAEKLVDKVLVLEFEYDSFSYDGKEILPWLDSKKEYSEKEMFLTANRVSEAINRNPQDSIFNFNGGRIVEFVPSKEGVEVDENTLVDLMITNLKRLENEDVSSIKIAIPVDSTSPKITNDEVNNLGINTLVGRGSSRFRGSISSRIYNIGLSSSKFDGVLIKPGEVFSFNNTVGEIDALTGYKEAYIIQDGATVLGDGGGVCQVSTTLFRAALDAGLPIVSRRAHSYRVGYYEQDGSVGFDATIYSPTTDFKFKNDTPNHLLIQTLFDARSASLVFEIYGTDDGRNVTISTPVVWDVVPPPEDLYTDDPTKPAGEIEQIDYKAWGAKAKFNYFVEKSGEVLQDQTFYSTYRPWQAKFLRGTGPVQKNKSL